jgi:hypothetical protein
MGRKSRFDIARKRITAELNTYDTSFFTYKQLSKVFDENRYEWRLPVSWYVNKFIDALLQREMLLQTKIEFPNTTHLRYIWGESFYLQGLATSIHHSAYISHYSAMAHHGLTDQVPKVTYVTVEQSSKPYKGTLTQKGIDSAFSKPQRKTNAIAELGNDEKRITIQKINGKYTNSLGVSKADDYRVTNLERTLIDATVRPAYCGGVTEVLEAYRRAATSISINKLKALLKKLDYTYPYHQAIGFYMQSSGSYTEKQYEQLASFPMDFRFYLTYDMRDKEFSDKWQLYFPKFLKKGLPF